MASLFKEDLPDDSLQRCDLGICVVRLPKLREFNRLNSKVTTRSFIRTINQAAKFLDLIIRNSESFNSLKIADGAVSYFQTTEAAIALGEAVLANSWINSALADYQGRNLVIGVGCSELKFMPVTNRYYGLEQDLLMDISALLTKSSGSAFFITEQAYGALAEGYRRLCRRQMLMRHGRKVNIYQKKVGG